MTVAVKQLNIRVPIELMAELDAVAREEELERTVVARRLLREGIRRWKLEHALRLYERDEVTKGRAAEIAGISLYDMLDIIQQRKIPSHYSLDDALEDIKMILERQETYRSQVWQGDG